MGHLSFDHTAFPSLLVPQRRLLPTLPMNYCCWRLHLVWCLILCSLLLVLSWQYHRDGQNHSLLTSQISWNTVGPRSSQQWKWTEQPGHKRKNHDCMRVTAAAQAGSPTSRAILYTYTYSYAYVCCRLESWGGAVWRRVGSDTRVWIGAADCRSARQRWTQVDSTLDYRAAVTRPTLYASVTSVHPRRTFCLLWRTLRMLSLWWRLSVLLCYVLCAFHIICKQGWM